MITVLLLEFSNLICCIFKKKSRIISILSVIYIVLLIAGYAGKLDLPHYVRAYRNSAKYYFDLSDFGYNILQAFFSSNGFSFYFFRLSLSIISVFLIFNTAHYFKVNIHWIIIMYFSYLIFMDTIQYRNFVAMSVFVFSFRYLMSEKKFATAKYVVCIIVAGLFHLSILFSLVYLLYKNKNKKVIKHIILYSAIIGFITIFISRKYPVILFWISNKFFTGRGLGYLQTRTGLSLWAIILLHCFDVFVLWICVKHSYKCETNYKYINGAMFCNTAVLLTIPFLAFSASFYRYIRNLSLINYIAFGKEIDTFKFKDKKRYLVIALVIISIFLWGYTDLYLFNGNLKIIDSILNHNIFWGVDKITFSEFFSINKIG